MDIGCFLKYGTRFSCNLNGTDFIPTFLENTRHKLRIFLLGSRGNVVKEAARVLALRFPAHRIVGFHDGYFPEERSAEIAEKIRRANANVLLVAMGNCMQELWIADNLERTGATLALGVGALFDFISKRVPRAPRLVRASCLEWLWRLMLEPRRLWRRYTIRSVLFLFYASKDALAYQWREVRCRLWGSLDFTAAMASVDRKKAIGKAFNRKPGTI
jgi:alpha-1,3-mannosyltransferase